MFNKQAADAEQRPDEALLERLAALEAAVQAHGVSASESKGPKCLTEPTTFASRRAVAKPATPPPLVSMGMATQIIETVERGHRGERRVEVEYFVEKGHGARIWGREPGGPVFPVERAR